MCWSWKNLVVSTKHRFVTLTSLIIESITWLCGRITGVNSSLRSNLKDKSGFPNGVDESRLTEVDF